MLTLRELASVAAIADPVMRRLIEQRFAELSQAGEFDSARMGHFVLVEPGDVGERIEA
jgi:ABC-type enterochelin transport system permease subunit